MSAEATSPTDPGAVQGDDPDAGLLLRPVVRWPRTMTVRRRHLVEVDLDLVTRSGAPLGAWPFEEEEIAYTCLLSGGDGFDLWAVNDASVIVHRFGGSYGPAEFVVTPLAVPPPEHGGGGSLSLTIFNPWGVRIGTHELKVRVRAAEDGQGHEPTQEVPAGVSDLTAGLADADHLTVDLGASRQVTEGRLATDPGRSDRPTRVDDLMRAAPRTVLDEAPWPSARDDQDEPDDPHRTVRLTTRYSVALLRRSRTGTLRFELLPLFFPGATAGARADFTVRCVPSDKHGTVFAVIAESPGSGETRPRLLSMQSGKFPPGTYPVTAELVYPYPGYVRFHGLPGPLREESRRWEEITAALPSRLAEGTGPAHVIVAIEISGLPDVVARRVECVRWLIEHVAATAEGTACYSVITYGPHSINDRNVAYPEVPVTTLAWAEPAAAALGTLDRLARYGAAPSGYPAAAQLECLLADLARELTGHEGRPVLVTAGARPPHPPHRDLASVIIPCRVREDWRTALDQLRQRHRGMAFGAIHDSGRLDDLWRGLGRDATMTVDQFYAPDFASALGLTAAPVQLLPFPMTAEPR